MTKVGIVIVSYNASEAVLVTLASVSMSKNRTPYELILVDNNSRFEEIERLKILFSEHQKSQVSWRLIELSVNLGFSGGNNVGIREFLVDESITHICLLNSDVIVGDYWLDRLVGKDEEILSCVTNRADSEQCVPIDYSIHLEDCLSSDGIKLKESAYQKINNFSQRWFDAWSGNIVEGEATFFCVLFKREVLQKVGLLDETFFPGGFEDDDYCIRARDLGYKIVLSRDVFIHHWGSASFGLLQASYFQEKASKNRTYLESKHGFKWKKRYERPFLSYFQDLLYSRGSNNDKQKYFLKLYGDCLKSLLMYYHKNLHLALKSPAKDLVKISPEILTEARSLVKMNVAKKWIKLAESKKANETDYKVILDEIYQLGNISVLLSELSQQRGLLHSLTQKLLRVGSLLKVGVPFYLKFSGIVFFAGYPYSERERDGYYQRIKAIDEIFADRIRVYVDSDGVVESGGKSFIHRPAPNVIVLKSIWSSKSKRFLFKLIILFLVMKAKVIYFHSVLQMHKGKSYKLMYFPFVKKIVDIHGVVPEEFRFHEDYFSARLYEKYEEIAIRRADVAIVVSKKMMEYYQAKYSDIAIKKLLILPIFPSVVGGHQKKINEKPVVVYAGGLQRWQQVPKMVQAISSTIDICEHRFYCPEPETVKAMFCAIAESKQLTIESRPQSEIMEIYRDCDFGFILREDIVVNNVSCPTKLIEYIAMGVIPIFDSENVGGMKELGLQFISLENFSNGLFPTEDARKNIIENNKIVYADLLSQADAGRDFLKYDVFRKNYDFFKNFPEKSVRKIYSICPYPLKRSISSVRQWRDIYLGNHQECDVLMQVDNFLSGGLENVVLHLSKYLISRGSKVQLLVLGQCGVAVDEAIRSGIAVHRMSFSKMKYDKLIKTLKPKIVIAHYSFSGAEMCKSKGIPFVQVIHNAYVWLNSSNRYNFEIASEFTSLFIAVSDFVQRYSIERLGVDADRCITISNGIDMDAVNSEKAKNRENLRVRFGFQENNIVFLSVGAINHQKNHLSTVRAFIKAYRDNPKVRLLILGPCYEIKLLEAMNRLIKQSGTEKVIIYGGVASDMGSFYYASDVLLHNALFEGGPLVFLEALAANKPIITSDVGIAHHFRGLPGINIIPSHVDIFQFEGSMEEIQPSARVEEILAAEVLKVSREVVKPNLPSSIVEMFASEVAYSNYVDTIEVILSDKKMKLSDWSASIKDYKSGV